MDVRARYCFQKPQLENYRDVISTGLTDFLAMLRFRCSRTVAYVAPRFSHCFAFGFSPAKSGYKKVFALLLMAMLTACGQADHFGAHPTNYPALQGWQDDDHAAALSVFKTSCPALENHSVLASGSGLEVNSSVWQSLCTEAEQIPPGDREAARQFFERRFVPYRVNNNGKEQGLFTGYYEPVLYGAWHKGGDFQYPLYLPPSDLKNSKPYYTREEIDDGALKGRKLEIVWVDDPVMLFFMHIQGSGRIRLKNGKEVRIGYADQNGQEYVGLGKIMGDENLLPKDQINFFTLRQWLYDHKDQAFAMMQRNPSYVFFKKIDGPGPIGAVGTPLTPKRSIAVDKNYIPYGLPLFMETELPAEPQEKTVPFHRLMIAQDTGGAIRGPVRADIFFGSGEDAEYLAGYMKGHGVYSLLVPKEIESQLPH